MDADDDYEAAEEEEEDEGEDQLYPGLYRALYAFEPEGTAEMRLEEDQIVRVVGRGGGVGWAVVVVPEGEEVGEVNGGVGVLVAEGAQGGKATRHALVPESYLEPGFSRASKTRKDGINVLLYTLERYLSSRTFQAEELESFVQRQLSYRVQNATSPHKVYEAVSNFLIHRNFPSEAVSVVQRMQKAGYVPSSLLQAQMVLVALAHSVGRTEPLVEQLTKYFESNDCTEKEFLLLFDTMNQLSINSEIIVTLVSSFVDSREPGYIPDPKLLRYLIQASIKAGELDMAFEATNAIPPTHPGLHEARGAYVDILSAITDSGIRDSTAVDRVLHSMKEKGLQPNIAVLNVLLAREVRLNRRAAAFRIYRLIQSMAEKDPVFNPDRYTFGTMFAMYRAISLKAMRHFHGKPSSEDAYPPRALFRDFMRMCNRDVKTNTQGANPTTNGTRTSTIQPNATLLTTALKVFMRHRDYAGAFVSLSSFHHLGVSLDHRTWYSIIKPLIRRVWAELNTPPTATSIRWAYHFLGLTEKLPRNALDERVVNGVLDTIARPTFSLMEPLYVPGRALMAEGERKYKVPTMEMMESVMSPREGFVYEVNPLKRLLRRAVLAQVMEWEGGSVDAKRVSEEIALAKKEML
ncbi:hypothetical protein CVT24_008691 [Panaeolus cyanescens]|uniref:SH3 domain-containing protein n=1 Tax=Panaeolus cyanescens TaxID=181874 RepID=A0A409VKP1_9AGAR|nr:hypothetical protein CVT24_008691 [Panaeolus cyanescens]